MRHRRNNQQKRQRLRPRQSQLSLDLVAHKLIRVVFICIVGSTFRARSTEATFGHEHVHIRVHVPQIKNEVHHTEKSIVKEIPIIRHRYKESIVSATHPHLRPHLYRDNDDDDDNDNVRSNNHVVEDGYVDDDDSTSFAAAVAAPPSGTTWSHAFRHRNSLSIDDDVVAQQPATATYLSYLRSNLLREQHNESPASASIPSASISYGRPFAMSASIGRDGNGHSDGDGAGDEHRYAKTWPTIIASTGGRHPAVAVIPSDRGEKNTSALYKIVKHYAPSMTHPQSAIAIETFDQVVADDRSTSNNGEFRQNFVDYYYHTAPEKVTAEGIFVDVAAVDDHDHNHEDDDGDDSNEFVPLVELNWNKREPKLKNHPHEAFNTYDLPIHHGR